MGDVFVDVPACRGYCPPRSRAGSGREHSPSRAESGAWPAPSLPQARNHACAIPQESRQGRRVSVFADWNAKGLREVPKYKGAASAAKFQRHLDTFWVREIHT